MITIQDIVKDFGGLRAVDHCSFQIAKGSITGLIGPNGAGKSTLFNIVAGFLKPDGGSVLMDGQNITGVAPHKLFHKGIIRTFQVPHEFGRMTVLENLMIVPAGQTGEKVLPTLTRWSKVQAQEKELKNKAKQVLEFLQLPHLQNELAGNLSGGQKKLLELGRTMMADPKLILLDEPGAGVNRTLMGKLAADIRRLNSDFGYTFCIIEHDMDLIMELCDPVVVMAEGKVLAQGHMADLRQNEKVREAYLGSRSSTQETACEREDSGS